MELTLAGYFPKVTAVPADWSLPAHLTEICSVSNCVNRAPARWVELWLHNQLWLFDSPGDARLGIGDDPRAFEIFAYRLAPLRFVEGRTEPWPVERVAVEPLPADFQSLGFDAVSASHGVQFECSPLSCNRMAAEIPVNRYCLVDTLEDAIAAAVRFSSEQPEPGPYHVLEVLRGKG